MSAELRTCAAFYHSEPGIDSTSEIVKNYLQSGFRCWKRMPFKTLLGVCQLFWSLTKSAQDALLWSMQSGLGVEKESDSESDGSGASSEEQPRRLSWFLAGTQVCRRAFLQMLGVSCQRLTRTREQFQGLDARTLKGQKSNTRPAVATASVNTFMQKMYYSVSETMPTGLLVNDSI